MLTNLECSKWVIHNYITYTIIQSITSSEMCSLHLTHPSAHTLGAVGSQRCGTQGAVGSSVPCSRVSPQSWKIPAGTEIQTHNLGLQVRHSTSHDCPLTLSKHMTLSKDPFESRILYQCTIHETSCNTINTLYTCRYRCICKKTLTAQGIMQLFNIFTVQYVLLTASGWNG